MGEIVETTTSGTSMSTGFSADEYNAVATKAKLRSINLLQSSFEVASELMTEQDRWKLGYGVAVKNCKYDPEQGWVAAIMRYNLTAKVGRRNAVKCVAEFGVFYDVGPVGNVEAAEGFCHNIGMYAAYPYFRSLVATLAWNAGLDLPPLPAIASTAHIQRKDAK